MQITHRLGQIFFKETLRLFHTNKLIFASFTSYMTYVIWHEPIMRFKIIQGNTDIIETVDEIKLLGTVITNDMKWEKNTSYLTKKDWKRMQLLYNAAKFTRQRKDLKDIYTTFIRPVLEQSAPVWHSSLTKENSDDLERIQKCAVRVILGKQHTSYENSLEILNLKKLTERREYLSLTFAKRSLKNSKVKHMFPFRKELRSQTRRKTERFEVKRANTARLKMSAIPYMQRLLNRNYPTEKLNSF